MKTNSTRAIVLSICALALLLLACSLIGQGASDGGGQSGGTILYQDDFSDPNSGWNRSNSADGVADYADGSYRITVLETNYDIWATAGQSLSDARIEVDATKVGGPDDNDFGVICRLTGTQDFYAFLISSDGYYGIFKSNSEGFAAITGEGMESSSAIHQGETSNRVRADCVGDTLTLFANGTQLQQVTDSELLSGDVGLIAGTFSEPGTEMLFDNFIAYRP
jgi:hypothetical protein